MAYDHSWKAILNPGLSEDYFTDKPQRHFNAHGDGFSPVKAWWLSELSRLMYRQDHTEGIPAAFSRDDVLRQEGLTEKRFIANAFTQCALVETSGDGEAAFAALVFRGTTGHLLNWWRNLDMARSTWPAGGLVHRGFKSVLLSVWEAIENALKKTGKPLFYTGHSLGGALAIMAASLRTPRGVYTFGAPRPGNGAFAETVAHVPVYNIRNPKDIVADLPPSGRGDRFTHPGITVRNRTIFLARRALGQAPAFLADHAPLNYTVQLPQKI